MTAPAVGSASELAVKFEEIVDKMGDDVTAASLKAYAAWQSGQLATDGFAQIVANLLAIINTHARAAGDVFATLALNRTLGMKAVPLGDFVTADADLERLGKAATTIAESLDTGTDVPMQLERIARNEPAEAAQQQVVASYRRHGVKGYRRHPDSDPCELCVWLIKAHLDPEGIGYIYPANKRFHRHTGCKCTPIPAIRKEGNR